MDAVIFAAVVGLILILCRDGVKINIKVNHNHKHEYKQEAPVAQNGPTAEEYHEALEKYNQDTTEALGSMIRSINETMGVNYEDPNGTN